MMIFKHYFNALKKYASFAGRARRAEFWSFYLISGVILTSLSYVSEILMYGFGYAVLLPVITVTVRRLHDIGKSGAWWFIAYIPLIGTIWRFILLVSKGDIGDNIYGPDPKINTVL